MVLLSAHDLTKNFGARTLFSGLNFEISEGDRVGLIGVNGCGKSTLFKLITGELSPDGGSLGLAKLASVGYVQQHVSNDSTREAYDEVLSVFAPLMDIERKLADLNAEIEAAQADPVRLEGLVRRQHVLSEQFERDGGYTFRARSRSALLGLGFTEDMLSRPVCSLSGGEKAKVSLARMLLSGANLLLLDEPTNHLDIAAVEWLEDYLLACRSAYVVISHDRYFLDRVTTRTLEIENGHLQGYTGGYTAYIEKKSKEREFAERHYRNTMKEIHRIEGIVEQQRRWNRERNIRTAESKLKEIARLEATLEKPDQLPDALHFSFDAPEAVTNDVVTARGLCKSFGDKVLLHNADLLIKKGDRAFLLGANGCGKTTLFRMLTGSQPPDGGSCALGPGVTSGYYDQTMSNLHEEKSVMDELWDRYPHMTQSAVRTALGRFLFRGDDVFKRVGELSGGERARLCLLELMLSGANLLLLDEPTNHLDISSREALEAALAEFNGTLFIISHDRYFINRLATRVVRMEQGDFTNYEGNYDAYLAERKRLEELREKAPPEKPQKSAGALSFAVERDRRAEARRLRARMGEAERENARLSERAKAIEAELSDEAVAADYVRVTELTQELEDIKARSDALAEEWMEHAEMLERFET